MDSKIASAGKKSCTKIKILIGSFSNEISRALALNLFLESSGVIEKL